METMNTYTQTSAPTSTETQHRVLRNTYGLLALSMVPTVLGAWVGVTTGITGPAGNRSPARPSIEE